MERTAIRRPGQQKYWKPLIERCGFGIEDIHKQKHIVGG